MIPTKIASALCTGMILLAFVASASTAQAQDEPAPDNRSALAEQVIALSQGDNLQKSIEQEMRKVLDTQDGNGLHAEQQAWMRSQMPRMGSLMVDRMLEQMVPIYADIFTEAELQAQIAFYNTDAGRSIANKTVELGVRQGQILEAEQLLFLENLMDKFCGTFECLAVEYEQDGQPSSGKSSR